MVFTVYIAIALFILVQQQHILLKPAKAFSYVQRKWDFLLPRDVMEKIFALEADQELDKMEVERLTDQLLREMPRIMLEQLDLPKFYSRLPFNARWQIKELLFDKHLNWRQKHEAIFGIVQSLTPHQRQLFVAPNFRSPVGEMPTLSGAGHSRLFESLNALKYTVSFTFKIQELCDALPSAQAAQIYSALSRDKLSIEQKLANVESVMSELSSSALDRLFFAGVPIVDAEVRERFRRLWYDRPYWAADDDDDDMNVPPKNIGLPAPPQFSPMALQIIPIPQPAAVQYPPNNSPLLTYSTISGLPYPPIPSSPPAPVPIPAVPLSSEVVPPSPQTVTIDEHYNLAPPLQPTNTQTFPTRRGGLCAECNGKPDTMTSMSNVVVQHQQGLIGGTGSRPVKGVEPEPDRPTHNNNVISIRVPALISNSDGPIAFGEDAGGGIGAVQGTDDTSSRANVFEMPNLANVPQVENGTINIKQKNGEKIGDRLRMEKRESGDDGHNGQLNAINNNNNMIVVRKPNPNICMVDFKCTP